MWSCLPHIDARRAPSSSSRNPRPSHRYWKPQFPLRLQIEKIISAANYMNSCDEEPSAMVFATCCILANCPLLTAAVFSGRPTVGSYHVADDKKAKSLENIGRKPKEGNIVAAIIRKSANSWVAVGCKDHWNALLFIFLTFLLLRLNISIGQSFFFQKWSRIDRPSWTWRFMFGCSF